MPENGLFCDHVLLEDNPEEVLQFPNVSFGARSLRDLRAPFSLLLRKVHFFWSAGPHLALDVLVEEVHEREPHCGLLEPRLGHFFGLALFSLLVLAGQNMGWVDLDKEHVRNEVDDLGVSSRLGSTTDLGAPRAEELPDELSEEPGIHLEFDAAHKLNFGVVQALGVLGMLSLDFFL